MGVMACNRNGCKNVMCDRYSEEHGYLCDECFDELVAIRTLDFGAFMASPKKHVQCAKEIKSVCEAIFRRK